jgi:hypothetical protein
MKGDKARENYFTATFYIPLIENEIENEVFLNQTAYIFQNIFFYDDAFRGENWQLFTT